MTRSIEAGDEPQKEDVAILAYPEFLAAWKAREEQPEAYARSRSRVELFGSAKVMWRVRGIEQATSFSYEDMANTYPLLIDAMREDLGREPSEEL